MNRPKIISFTICFLLLALGAMAQPLPPAPTEAAPLDGFTLTLLALGAGYGTYKARTKKL